MKKMQIFLLYSINIKKNLINQSTKKPVGKGKNCLPSPKKNCFPIKYGFHVYFHILKFVQ